MTKWQARALIAVLAVATVWCIAGGLWPVAAVLAVVATVIEIRWAERWWWRSRSS